MGRPPAKLSELRVLLLLFLDPFFDLEPDPPLPAEIPCPLEAVAATRPLYEVCAFARPLLMLELSCIIYC